MCFFPWPSAGERIRKEQIANLVAAGWAAREERVSDYEMQIRPPPHRRLEGVQALDRTVVVDARLDLATAARNIGAEIDPCISGSPYRSAMSVRWISVRFARCQGTTRAFEEAYMIVGAFECATIDEIIAYYVQYPEVFDQCRGLIGASIARRASGDARPVYHPVLYRDERGLRIGLWSSMEPVPSNYRMVLVR